MVVDGVSLRQDFRQLVIRIRPNLLPHRLQRHGPDRAGDHSDQVLAVTAAHIDLAVEQVQEIEGPRIPSEAVFAAAVAAIPHANVRPALVAEKVNLVQCGAGGGFEFRPKHRIDPERVRQQQMTDDLGGLGERFARPPAQVIGHVDEHARPRPATNAAGDVHGRRAVRGQDVLVRLLLHELLRARSQQAAETGRDRLVNHRLAQLEEDEAPEPRNALAAIVGKRGVLPKAPDPVEMGVEFRIADVVPHDLTDVQEMEQVDEVGHDSLRRPAIIRGIGIELQETDE